MAQRESGYARIERDNYTTPEWVTRALLPHLPAPPLHIWEPAAGSGGRRTSGKPKYRDHYQNESAKRKSARA
jgi:hypothetical protein